MLCENDEIQHCQTKFSRAHQLPVHRPKFQLKWIGARADLFARSDYLPDLLLSPGVPLLRRDLPLLHHRPLQTLQLLGQPLQVYVGLGFRI